MDPKRKGEIAYKFLKVVLVHDLSLKNIGHFRRRAGNLAEETGIDIEEILVFSEMIIREVIEEQIQEGFAPNQQGQGH